jgi:hypothetical protein
MKKILAVLAAFLFSFGVSAAQVAGNGGSTGVVGNGSSILRGSAYDATIMAESSLTHFWRMNDAPGSTYAADMKGSANLTVVGSANLHFGAPSISGDYETSLYLPGLDTNYLSFPAGTLPTTDPVTLEWVVLNLGTSATEIFFSADASASADIGLHTGAAQPSGYQFQSVMASGYTVDVGPYVSPMLPEDIVLEVQTGGNPSVLYINGVLVSSGGGAWGSPINTVGSGAGSVGRLTGTTGSSFIGLMSKFAIYNSFLSLNQIQAHVQALGLI